MARRALWATLVSVILMIVGIAASTPSGKQLSRQVLEVISCSPANIVIKPGGPAATVTVGGSRLDTVTDVQIIQKGVRVSGITAEAGRISAERTTFSFAAANTARVGTFQVRLTTKLHGVLDIPTSVFAIKVVPPIDVTEPRAGAIWKTGELATIAWNHAGNPPGPYVRIDLYRGANLNYPIETIYPIGQTGNSLVWRLQLTLSEGSDYRLKVTSTVNDNYSGFNPGPFTVKKVPERDITLLQPLGGENWQIGSTQEIKWKHRSDPSFLDTHRVLIYLEKGQQAFGDFRAITPSPIPIGAVAGASYRWQIPADIPPGNDYWVKIYDFSNFAIFDKSFSYIKISGSAGAGGSSGAGDR